MYSGRITETGTVIETGSGLVIEAAKTAAGIRVLSPFQARMSNAGGSWPISQLAAHL